MKRIDILAFADEEPTTFLTYESKERIEEMIRFYKKTDQFIYGHWESKHFFEVLKSFNVHFVPLPVDRIELDTYNY